MKFELAENLCLQEMVLRRRDAMNRTLDLAPKFVEHFDKIYNNIDSEAMNHWANEMQAWLNSILNIKLKETNKPLTLEQRIDWFFTAGSGSDILFKDNPTEAEVYDDFIDLVAVNNDVKESLIQLDLSKGDIGNYEI